SGTVASVSSGATWRNLGTGDLTLSGDVSNAGTINFNANGATCGDADDISISSTSVTQRTWSGSGTYQLMDVTVQGQKTPVTPPPAFILARNGTNAGNNGPGWLFDSTCLSAPYTWLAGTAESPTACQLGSHRR